MRILTVALVSILLLILVLPPARGAATPAAVCAEAKLRAAGKKAATKLACHAKAASRGGAVDTTCLTKAETKFTDAFAKAEGKGGCILTGDAPAIEAAIDQAVDSVVNT